jgi:hypothetical protein
MDALYEKLKPGAGNRQWGYVTLSDSPPINDLMMEWTYEIDLDHLVFHVDCEPLFRLDNMPPDDVFIKGISFDHFEHRALYEHTPIQYRYNWHAPPPSPPPKALIAYDSFPNRSSTSSVHEILRVPVTLSSFERTRTTLVGLLVTRCMADRRVAHYIRVQETVPDVSEFPYRMLELALSFVNFSVGPAIPSLPCNPPSDIWDDFIWIREDVYLRITTHLDDEENLKASIGELVHHINTSQDRVGTIYGIAFSIFHCAIVRVDKDGQGTSFSHTPALQFLPSFYARKISTPGIEALSRLGCQVSGEELLSAIAEAYNLPHITHRESLDIRTVAERVPVEVWANIGDFLTSPKDLVSLASISRQAMSAAADLARYPWVLEYRLVDIFGSSSPIPETTASYLTLGQAKFTAVKGGREINVQLGQVEDHRSRWEMTFKVQTHLTGKLVMREERLHVSELSDDNANY